MPGEPGPERLVVLRGSIQGKPARTYADELRSRLDGVTVEFAATPAEERDLLPAADVATGMALTEAQLARADRLRLFACATTGTDHLPVAALAERGVAVTTGSGVHRPDAAEHVLSALLALVRRLPAALDRQQRRHWEVYHPRERLADRTATVVGLGPIGSAVAERLDAFGVETVGVRYSPEKGGPTDEVVGFDGAAFHDALARSSVLVLACPLTETTRGLVGAGELRTLPPSALLVNVARGPVVDTDALVAALRRGAVAGAALDVTDPEPLPADHPLWGFEDVVVTPHVAGFNHDYWAERAAILAGNVERVRETGGYDDLRNRVQPSVVG